MSRNTTRDEPGLKVANTLTALLPRISTGLYKIFACQFMVSGHALNAFQIRARVTGNAPQEIIASASIDFTIPEFPLLRASGDLTAQPINTLGSLTMDVSAYDVIEIYATSSNVAGSVVNFYYSLSD
jgi:hypothetical protein